MIGQILHKQVGARSDEETDGFGVAVFGRRVQRSLQGKRSSQGENEIIESKRERRAKTRAEKSENREKRDRFRDRASALRTATDAFPATELESARGTACRI